MKYLIIFITSFLFAFEVEFVDTQTINIIPNQKAILLKTKKPLTIDYTPLIHTKKGIVLLNYQKADEFVRNDLYFNGEIKDINIAILEIDKIRDKTIQKLNKYYKNCKLKKIIFLENQYKTIYFKAINLKITLKVILNCY